MWPENLMLRRNFDNASSSDLPWNDLKDKTIFITGATGLIGSSLVNLLIYSNNKLNLNMKIALLVRDKNKAMCKFKNQLQDNNNIIFIENSVEGITDADLDIDYIVHGASPTASLYFVNHPVETIITAVNGTKNMLELARKKAVKSFVYLSSMEVYGSPMTEDLIDEDYPTNINPLSVRSCYPEAKRLCENLCVCYSSEYNVPAKMIRLAQTFGPGVSIEENRVFAQFARSAINGNDIVLKTAGTSKRAYLHTIDSATAILSVLMKGEPGQAYNAANSDTYCSIKEMADMVALKIADGKINVKIDDDKQSAEKYLPTHCLNLDVSKLMSLGWKPTKNLEEIYIEMIEDMQTNQ